MVSSADRGAVLVTGGAAGIGLATARILLRDGWRVAILDREASALASARAEFSDDLERLRFDELDVVDADAVARATRDIAKCFGPIRGLVASAGVGANVSFFETTPAMFQKTNDVNVIGAFNTAKAAAEAMRETGGGAIVTVSSVSGLIGNAGRAAYGASKGALVNLTRIMAVELARFGIRVNSVAPGPIETAMAAAFHPADVRAQWCDEVLLGRYGSPAEVGEAIAFLIDDKRSSYITGQVLAVDGGFVAAGLIDRG